MTDIIFRIKMSFIDIIFLAAGAAALYSRAASYRVKALSVLRISDSLVPGEDVPALIREQKLEEMVEIGLNCF